MEKAGLGKFFKTFSRHEKRKTNVAAHKSLIVNHFPQSMCYPLRYLLRYLLSISQCSMLNVQCLILNGQWSILNGQWSILNGQCSMFNVQCSMFNGQWSMVNEKSAADYAAGNAADDT